jgi:hypothetical protein
MQRNLMVFYSANSSLAGLVACMLYPAFWQVLVVVAMSACRTAGTGCPGRVVRRGLSFISCCECEPFSIS